MAFRFGPPTIRAVVISTQTWMQTNLNVETYRNGDPIPEVTDPTAWAALTTGAWCYYSNDKDTYGQYGKLYNWYAVDDARGLAPRGWHVPTNTEWTTLITNLGGNGAAGTELKEAGTDHWTASNTGTNSSRFTAFGGGNRNFDGTFNAIKNNGFWWTSTFNTSTTAYAKVMTYNTSIVSNYNSLNKNNGYSVRCVKD
jgi:uncharacterized protein (TIGR02145 family)